MHPDDLANLKQFLEQSLNALNKMMKYGSDGVGPLVGAKELSAKYIKNPLLDTKFKQIDSLRKAELKKNFASGFVTSIGGAISLPIAIPSSMAISWILQIRMVAAMAHIAGYDIEDQAVKTSVALCLLGKKGKELIESDFHALQQKLTQGHFYSVPSKTLLMINQKIVAKLTQIAGNKGFSRLGKAIPLAGGLIGGALDYYNAKETADFAIELFGFNNLSETGESL